MVAQITYLNSKKKLFVTKFDVRRLAVVGPLGGVQNNKTKNEPVGIFKCGNAL